MEEDLKVKEEDCKHSIDGTFKRFFLNYVLCDIEFLFCFVFFFSNIAASSWTGAPLSVCTLGAFFC